MDLDGFDFGNGFPVTHHQQQQQQRRRYVAGSTNANAPTAEGYDPRGGTGAAAAAQHQQQQLGGGGGLSFHHQLNNNAAGSSSSNGTTHQQANMAMIGTNIATSPLNASLHLHSPLMPPPGTNAYNNHTTTVVGAIGGGNHLSNSNKNNSSHSSSRHLQQQQHKQQQQNLHMQQQQQRLQQQAAAAAAAAAALGVPPPIGRPDAHRQQQQQQQEQQQLNRRRRSSQHRHQHHHQQQQQQPLFMHQQQQHMKLLAGAAPYSGNGSSVQSTQPKRRKPDPVRSEPWMEEIRLTITNLSTEPMSGTVVMRRLQQRTDEVLSRYLPCVDFLVRCQQDLRKGLQVATSKRIYHNMLRDKMTPMQFYAEYIERLPEKFHEKSRNVMSPENMKDAIVELQKLCTNAKNAQRQGCETVKNTFLGGMKDGESWGLRKWLSKHGGALMICNDSECILRAVQKLQRSDDATIKLARRMRPLAKASLTRLMEGVPPSYQEQSSAHPFLPFFHRLESALRGISNFDPEDDDVICIDDDDEVEVLKAAPPKSGTNKRRSSLDNAKNGASGADAAGKRKAVDITIDDDDDDDDDNDKDDSRRQKSSKGGTIRGGSKKHAKNAVDSKPPSRKRAKTASAGTAGGYSDTDPYNIDSTVNGLMAAVADNDGDSEYMKALLRSLNDETDDDDDVMNINFDEIDRRTSMLDGGNNVEGVFDLPSSLDRMASYFESDQQDLVRPTNLPYTAGSDSFWDQSGPYAGVLRVFSNLLLEQDAIDFLVDPIDVRALENDSTKTSYLSIVKHPLCFRDIVVALVAHFDAVEMTVVGNSGNLQTPTLSSWNVWRGDDLLMAIDLVFLNTLAYDKATEGTKTNMRSRINRLRKTLWTGIKDIIEQLSPAADAETKRKLHPTRRSESSGFVVHKSVK